MVNRILETYDNVFDEAGEIKLCGRYACMGLIRACNNLVPEANFGDVETGFMNVERIKALVSELQRTT